MNILEAIDNVEEGKTYSVAGLDVEIGEADVHALNMLGTIYRELGGEKNYDQVSHILEHAGWWNITFALLFDNEMVARAEESGLQYRRVRITGAKSPMVWYADMIGAELEVYFDPDWMLGTGSYILREDYDRGPQNAWRHIDVKDCEVVYERAR